MTLPSVSIAVSVLNEKVRIAERLAARKPDGSIEVGQNPGTGSGGLKR